MMITNTSTTALDIIAMDIVGPISVTPDRFEVISTMQCLVTKFVVAVPMRDAQAYTVADSFVRNFVCYFGAPRVILIDQGTNFLSRFSKRVAKRFKIKKVLTLAYKQSSNPVKRIHANIHEFLSHHSSEFND